jgi:hypothetical protein
MDETVPSIWDPVSNLAIAAFVRDATWAYPILEVLHVIGLALVFAPIMLFDLRVLGFYRDMPIARWHRALLPWVYAGFTLNAVSGILMFASDAAEFAANQSFQVKIGLLAIAAVNAIYFETRLRPSLYDGSAASNGAKVSAALSIIMWLAIITAGRMMAYIK